MSYIVYSRFLNNSARILGSLKGVLKLWLNPVVSETEKSPSAEMFENFDILIFLTNFARSKIKFTLNNFVNIPIYYVKACSVILTTKYHDRMETEEEHEGGGQLGQRAHHSYCLVPQLYLFLQNVDDCERTWNH